MGIDQTFLLTFWPSWGLFQDQCVLAHAIVWWDPPKHSNTEKHLAVPKQSGFIWIAYSTLCKLAHVCAQYLKLGNFCIGKFSCFKFLRILFSPPGKVVRSALCPNHNNGIYNSTHNTLCELGRHTMQIIVRLGGYNWTSSYKSGENFLTVCTYVKFQDCACVGNYG